MSHSQAVARFLLGVSTAAMFAVVGCQNEAANQVAKQAPAPVKKAISKPSPSKPATSPAAKPAPKQGQNNPTAAKKGATAKQVNASSKTPVAKPTDSSKSAARATLVAVPKGTVVSAKLSDPLASSKNHAGDTFAAVLTSSVKVDGKMVIPKGTKVTGRVVTVKKKTPELTVALASVDLNGKSYKLATEPITAGKSSVKSAGADGDPATAEKEIAVPAQRRLRFKLAKDVKLPVAVKS